MASIATCKSLFESFIRHSLQQLSAIESELPTLPKFQAVKKIKKGGRNRIIFEEQTQPNWWQIPKKIRLSLIGSEQGAKLLSCLSQTNPFNEAIGKTISLPELGVAQTCPSHLAILNDILVSYLFATGTKRWNSRAFDIVWNDCISYFNPANEYAEFWLYAPIAFLSGLPPRIDLGDGFEIKKLSPTKAACIASLNPELAGITVRHRFTSWTNYYFIKKCQIKKVIAHESEDDFLFAKQIFWEPEINEEVALLRSLLPTIAGCPTYGIIRLGYPRFSGGWRLCDLPWKVNSFPSHEPVNRKQVSDFKRRRRQFLEKHGAKGWENVMASMRRFAVAWQNPFRSDILADIVAALEQLLIRSNMEINYKLRVRVAHYLSNKNSEQVKIAADIRDAYSYRSKVYHGGYVFDNPIEFEGAKRLKSAKGKKGNLYHDINEVNRLIYSIAGYYRTILASIIDRGEFNINWNAIGL